MFMGRKDTSQGRDNKRPGGFSPPPSQSSAGKASAAPRSPPEPRKKKSGTACNRVMWASIMALPWATFILCGIIIAATIAWQDYFLDAAKKTGKVFELVQSESDSYPFRLWRSHRKVVLGTAISVEVITLFVVIAAVLRMMQSAVSAGRMRRGPPRNHTWSSIYLALTGGTAVLMWFAVWWMVMLLGVSVAWQFGAVATRNLAQGALSQASAYSKINAINLAAPTAPQQIQRKYQQSLRPTLDAQSQLKVQKFLDQTVFVAAKAKLSVCSSTCLDAHLLRGAIGSSQCVCDIKKLRQISALASQIAKKVISVIACILCNAVAASLLVIDLVTRFIYARQEYEALGPRPQRAAKQGSPGARGSPGRIPAGHGAADVDDDLSDVYEDEEEDDVEAPPGPEEKVMSWHARPPSVASAQSSVPPGFQAPQARAPPGVAQQQQQQQAAAAAQQQRAQQAAQMQAAQQQAAMQQRAAQQAAVQRQQQTQQMLMELQQRKQQQQQQQQQQSQHYSYAQQIQQQRMMQQQQHPDADSVVGSDQQSVQSAWVMRR